MLDDVKYEGTVDAGLLRAFNAGITPPPLRGLAEWAEQEYYLPAESAAEPGLIDLSRTPYQYGICDAFDDDAIETISMMMAAQLAKTTIILAVMGQVASTPGMGAPILMIMPIEDNAEMLARERFAPMIKASPILRKSLTDNRKKGAGDKVLQKFFNNGTIVNFVGSNAPAKLASRPVKYLLADEVDRFAVSAGKEGDPLELGIKRTSTFEGNGKKVLITSTPTEKGVSVIERNWNKSDQRRYHCKCPHCEDMHVLEFENLRATREDGTDYALDDWQKVDGGEFDFKRAYYPCPACGAVWSEADRLQAVADGEWVIGRPEVTDHAGFHANALISPWVGNWQYAAKKFIEAQGVPELERTFVNTYLGIPFSSDDLKIDEQQIIDRMEDIGLDEIPADVLALTMGVDVQADRLEMITLGWGENSQTILSHEIIYGDTTGVRIWDDLDEAIGRKFKHALGNEIGYDAVAVDSGFLTQTVVAFAMKPRLVKVFAIKGVAGERPLWEMSKSKRKDGGKIFLVGVDDGKTQIMERLKETTPGSPSYIRIASAGSRSHEFAKQLLSEYRKLDFVAGRPKITWARKSSGHRAEVLDCTNYAWACRSSFKPNWEDRRRRVTRTEGSNKKRKWASFD